MHAHLLYGTNIYWPGFWVFLKCCGCDCRTYCEPDKSDDFQPQHRRRFLPPGCAGFNCTGPPMHTRLEVGMYDGKSLCHAADTRLSLREARVSHFQAFQPRYAGEIIDNSTDIRPGGPGIMISWYHGTIWHHTAPPLLSNQAEDFITILGDENFGRAAYKAGLFDQADPGPHQHKERGMFSYHNGWRFFIDFQRENADKPWFGGKMTGFNQLMVIFKDFQRIDDEKPHCTAGFCETLGIFGQTHIHAIKCRYTIEIFWDGLNFGIGNLTCHHWAASSGWSAPESLMPYDMTKFGQVCLGFRTCWKTFFSSWHGFSPCCQILCQNNCKRWNWALLGLHPTGAKTALAGCEAFLGALCLLKAVTFNSRPQPFDAISCQQIPSALLRLLLNWVEPKYQLRSFQTEADWADQACQAFEGRIRPPCFTEHPVAKSVWSARPKVGCGNWQGLATSNEQWAIFQYLSIVKLRCRDLMRFASSWLRLWWEPWEPKVHFVSRSPFAISDYCK